MVWKCMFFCSRARFAGNKTLHNRGLTQYTDSRVATKDIRKAGVMKYDKVCMKDSWTTAVGSLVDPSIVNH